MNPARLCCESSASRTEVINCGVTYREKQLEKTIKFFGDNYLRVRKEVYNIKVSQFLVSREYLLKLPRSWVGSIQRLLYFSVRVRFGSIHKFCRFLRFTMWQKTEKAGRVCGDLIPVLAEEDVVEIIEAARAASEGQVITPGGLVRDLCTVVGRKRRDRAMLPQPKVPDIKPIFRCETCGHYVTSYASSSMCSGCFGLVQTPRKVREVELGSPNFCPYSPQQAHEFEKDKKCRKRCRFVCKFCKQEPGYVHQRPPNTGYLSKKDLAVLPHGAWRTTDRTGGVAILQDLYPSNGQVPPAIAHLAYVKIGIDIRNKHRIMPSSSCTA